MKILKRMAALINKDVAYENEAKGTAVILRVYVLSMFLHLGIQVVLFFTHHNIPLTLYVVFMALCFVAAFLCTYRLRTQMTFWAVQALTLIWIIGAVFLMGWDCGIQHFLFVLLALSLVGGYHRIYVKIIMSIVYCIIRLSLYFYTLDVAAYYPLTRMEGIELQVINTVVIFLQMTLLIVTFSKEVQATERKLVNYNKRIVEMASRDPLTKLYNRRAMMEKMNAVAEKGHKSFCIAIADIDFFKKVNDTYGHEAGDETLRKVAEMLSLFMEEKGYVSRWGGEEFLFLFQNGNGDEVRAELDKLREQIGKMAIPYRDQVIHVHMTFGLQEYNVNKPLDATISSADEKLYCGKANGRNQVVF